MKYQAYKEAVQQAAERAVVAWRKNDISYDAAIEKEAKEINVQTHHVRELFWKHLHHG